MVDKMFANDAYFDLKKGLLDSFATLLTDAWNFTNAPAMFLIDSAFIHRKFVFCPSINNTVNLSGSR
jgi:hypothetical protein